VHIHLSVTTGGLSEDRTQWKNMFFHQATLMRMWRYQIISLFRKMQTQLTLPKNIKEQISTNFTFNKSGASRNLKTGQLYSNKIHSILRLFLS
jgi:hypothetical protein